MQIVPSLILPNSNRSLKGSMKRGTPHSNNLLMIMTLLVTQQDVLFLTNMPKKSSLATVPSKTLTHRHSLIKTLTKQIPYWISIHKKN